MPRWQLAGKVKSALALVAVMLAVTVTQVVAAQPAAAVPLPANMFINLHVISATSSPPLSPKLICPRNEVMIGIHFEAKKAICAQLNHGYRIYNHAYIDTPRLGTQVSQNPSMHGCTSSWFIQGIGGISLGNQSLTCVKLVDSQGFLVSGLTQAVHDGRGDGNNGTQSTIYSNGLRPIMHVCPRNYAMRGVHKEKNDLYCVG
jgi:hypothetical protein